MTRSVHGPDVRARRELRHGVDTALRVLPLPARLWLRQVKRAVLGQPPVLTASSGAWPTTGVMAPDPPVPSTRPAHALPSGPRPSDGTPRLEIRRRHVLAGSGPSPSVLEIGPAHNAILPKRNGFATRTVDYLDRAGLIEKYKVHTQYSADDIEEVDYVLQPGAAMATSITERFDLVLASHVIEHTTSLVDFLNECARLLRPGGVLALVVPDSRFCFDRFRQRSAIGALIDASSDPRSVHSVGTLTEFALYSVRHRGTTSWAPGHRGDYTFAQDDEDRTRIIASASSGSYVDVHRWVFTPHHLRLLLHDLADLGYVQVRETHFQDTIGHEFFVNLTVEGAGSGLSRSELVTLADDELRALDVPTWA